jgi:hypothetical protein
VEGWTSIGETVGVAREGGERDGPRECMKGTIERDAVAATAGGIIAPDGTLSGLKVPRKVPIKPRPGGGELMLDPREAEPARFVTERHRNGLGPRCRLGFCSCAFGRLPTGPSGQFCSA